MITKDKLKLLHSIRGFAALIVVIAHAKFPFWSGGNEYINKFPLSSWRWSDYVFFAVDMFTSKASIMVMVFFVLSGFFIAYSYEQNKWSLKNFYINRTIRIYSTYLGSIILTLILFRLAFVICPELLTSTNPREYNQDLIHAANNFNWKTFGWSLLFISKPVYIGYNYPYWSLLVEVMFYLIAPFFIKREKLFLLLTSCLLIVGFVFPNLKMTFYGFKHVVDFLTLYAFFFALGYFMYWLIFTYKIHEKMRQPNVWILNILGLITLLMSILIGLKFSVKVSFILGGFFTVIMIYRFLMYPVKITFLHRFFISMGTISYTMYLIHVPIFIFLYAILVRITGVEVFYSRIYWIPAIIAVLLSYPYYYLVEHQTLKLIRWFKKRTAKK